MRKGVKMLVAACVSAVMLTGCGAADPQDAVDATTVIVEKAED